MDTSINSLITQTMKIMRFFLSTMFLTIFLAQSASAQNEDYRHVVSVNAGLNIFQVLGAAQFVPLNDVQFSNAKGYGSPTFQFSYDYGFKKWFSLGFAFANNRFGAKYSNLVIANETIGDLNMKYTRNTFTSRVLFHYGNHDRLDMYSGLRLGVSLWNSKPSKDITDAQATALFESGGIGSARGKGVLPHVGMTLFGLRYYVTENLGIGFESNIGSYLASAQVNYRLGSGEASSSSKSPSSKKKKKK
jgi:hypothetical protein